MSETAIATTSEQSAAPARDRPIPKRIRQVVELLVTGECTTQKAASERVGLHPDYVCRSLKAPQVRVFIERRARETIAAGMMRASARLNELVDATSEHVSFDATKHVLALAGIKPVADAQVSVNIELKAGYVIDISETERPAPITIDGVASD
jgi:hypothetical protein